MTELQPYDRKQYAKALAANALANPFNLGVLVAMAAAGALIGHFALLLVCGLVVYGLAVTRTFFDDEEAQKVFERERADRRAALEASSGLVADEMLDGEIRAVVASAQQRAQRIREAVARARLPYDQVSEEVENFLLAIRKTAARAQLLSETLRDNPPQAIRQRLRAVQGSPERRASLSDALSEQLRAQERIEQQLQHFFDQMEQVLVEMDTVRSNLISVATSTETADQERLASEVRGLRQEVSLLADGMATAYQAQS